MVNDAYRSYFQRYRQNLPESRQDSEAYVSMPGFLLSAGGTPTDRAYSPNPRPDDDSVVENTALIPKGEYLSVKDLIRFDNLPDKAGMCVAPASASGFACGVNTKIPPNYLANSNCVIKTGRWTFIDVAHLPCRDPSQQNAALAKYGFFVAVYNAIPDIDSPPKDPQFGFLEVVPVSSLLGLGLSTLTAYEDLTLNIHMQAAVDFTSGKGTFIAADGTQIQVDFYRNDGEAPIFSSGDVSTWDRADGPIFQNSGSPDLVKITLPGNVSPSIIMDFTNVKSPVCTGC
ncbi:MAG: hypothetical protein JOZ87_34580 [Chloroflexi bacterium]|nr:hypothetical protein [Chloroflexota bacterium]